MRNAKYLLDAEINSTDSIDKQSIFELVSQQVQK